jgi:hypothetical protein
LLPAGQAATFFGRAALLPPAMITQWLCILTSIVGVLLIYYTRKLPAAASIKTMVVLGSGV